MTTASATNSPSQAPGGPSPDAIRVDALRHQYSRSARRSKRAPTADPTPADAAADRPALAGVSFTVHPGEIFGILGPNGSGKSTLFRILSTMLRPQAGTAEVFGRDVVRDAQGVRRSLGVVFQAPSLDVKLTARENLVHQGHLYGLAGAELDERINALLGQFGLENRGHEFVERFSGGMRRKVELAKALLHRPRLLLMDEPSTGLDPGARADLWRQLEALRRDHGVTVALTTHLMEEADRCDRLAIMNQGTLVALDTPANLKRQIGGDVVTIVPKRGPGETEIASHVLAQLIRDKLNPPSPPLPRSGDEPAQAMTPVIEPAVVDGLVRFEHPEAPSLVARIAAEFPDRIASITVGHPTLLDVFVHLTGRPL